MPRDYRYTVSLRIWHPDSHPDRFTEALGLAPHAVDIPGQPRVRRGRTLPFVPKRSFWTTNLGFDPALDVEDFLLEHAKTLSPRRALFDAIANEGGGAEFFIGFFIEDFNCGFVLSPALQRVCADLGLSLAFDVYGHHDRDGNEDERGPDPAVVADEGIDKGAER